MQGSWKWGSGAMGRVIAGDPANTGKSVLDCTGVDGSVAEGS